MSDGTIKETNRKRLLELHEKLLDNLEIKFLLPSLYTKGMLLSFIHPLGEWYISHSVRIDYLHDQGYEVFEYLKEKIQILC